MGTSLKSWLPALLSSLLMVTVSGVVSADEPAARPSATADPEQPSAADVKRADVLFQKALLLKKLGKEAEACPLFVESQNLDPNGATLVKLAECHESEGKTGTAWRDLMAALKLAKRTGDEGIVKWTRAQLVAIVPKLHNLTIQIPREIGAIPGVEVMMDDKLLPPEVPVYFEVVDPGRHRVHASAPGYVDFYKEVALAGANRNATVLVSLEKPPPPPPPDYTPAIVWMVGGGTSLVGGAVLSGLAATATIDNTGLWIGAGVALLAGAAAVVGGAIIYPSPAPAAPSITRHEKPERLFALQPVFGPNMGGLSLTGSF